MPEFYAHRAKRERVEIDSRVLIRAYNALNDLVKSESTDPDEVADLLRAGEQAQQDLWPFVILAITDPPSESAAEPTAPSEG